MTNPLTNYLLFIMEVAETYQLDVHETIFVLVALDCQLREDQTNIIRFCNSGTDQYVKRILVDGTSINAPIRNRVGGENIARLIDLKIISGVEIDQELNTPFPNISNNFIQEIRNLASKYNLELDIANIDFFDQLEDMYPAKAGEIKFLKVNIPEEIPQLYANYINNDEVLHRKILNVIKANKTDDGEGNENLSLSLRNFVKSKYWNELLKEVDTRKDNVRL